MMRVRIEDEATRRLMRRLLWKRAADAMGGRFDEELVAEFWDSEDDFDRMRREAGTRLEMWRGLS